MVQLQQMKQMKQGIDANCKKKGFFFIGPVRWGHTLIAKRKMRQLSVRFNLNCPNFIMTKPNHGDNIDKQKHRDYGIGDQPKLLHKYFI